MSAPLRTRPFGHPFPGAPFIGGEELEAVAAVLHARSPSRFSGVEPLELCDRFERDFAAYVGASHAVATGSGSGALNVALAALGVGPGQEVIVPGYMWIATLAAVVHRGAIPVLCEIDDTYTMSPEDLRRKITPKTTVVLPVHMSGATGDLEEVCAVAREHGLKVLEDCAQACGGSYRGRKLGTFGDAAIFSFQYTKAMTTGEGGMVTTSDPGLHLRCRAAHDVGHAEDPEGGPPAVLWGLGTVMTELQAAMGLVQLGKLDRIVLSMRRAKHQLLAGLHGIRGLELRRTGDPSGDNGSFLVTRYPNEEAARAMAAELIALGLTAGPGGRLVHHFLDWGFHIYSNVPQLVERWSNSPDGFPWTHPLNAGSERSYAKGALPKTDDLFARSVLQAIPSASTSDDVVDMVAIYREAARRVLG